MSPDQTPTEVAFRRQLATLDVEAATLGGDAGETIRPPRPGESFETPALDSLPSLSHTEALSSAELDLGDVIGEGGMGIVRLARQLALRRTVAVKTLKGQRDGERTSGLLREARVTGALEHPNVVPVYSLGRDDTGAPLLVMKRVEGRSWRALMAELPSDVAGRVAALDAQLDVFLQVCNAVHFAHSRGVVHRDLKPDNVMVGGFGEVYVLDWGIAVAWRSEADTVFPRPADLPGLVGTPAYMSPEMSVGDGALLSPRTDVYLLGAMLHELVTGRKRHEGDVLQCLYKAFVSEAPVYGAEVPRELAAIVSRALERDPARRFETAEELRQALVEFRKHRSSRDLTAEAVHRLAEVEGLLRTTQPDAIRVQRLLGEARFGLEQAIHAWPQNDEARAAQRRALELVCDFELQRGDANAAARALAEMGEVPPEIAGRVAELERRIGEERKRVAAMETVMREQDLGVSYSARLAIIAGIGISWTIVPFFVAWQEKVRGLVIGDDEYLKATGVFAAVIAFLVFLGRKVLWRNQAAKQIVATLSVLVLLTATIRLNSFLQGTPMATTAPSELVGYAVIGFMLALWMDSALFASGLTYLLGSVAMSLLPGYSFEVVGVSTFIAMGSTLLLILRRSASKREEVAPGAAQ